MLPPVPGTEARWRPGSADPTAPEVSQAPGLRQLRLAESSRPFFLPETETQQVIQVPGSNLSNASPGPGRAPVGNGETGRVQSQRIPPGHGHGQPAGG